MFSDEQGFFSVFWTLVIKGLDCLLDKEVKETKENDNYFQDEESLNCIQDVSKDQHKPHITFVFSGSIIKGKNAGAPTGVQQPLPPPPLTEILNGLEIPCFKGHYYYTYKVYLLIK